MAEKCVESNIGREICLVRGKNGKYLGYKKDILVENLSERENTMFVCIRCQGIMREVCTSSAGEQFCSCCKKEDEQANPNLQMDNMILSFKSSCPLIMRGCKWLGTLRNCENHLDTCGYVYETCKLRCGVVLQRNELNDHEMEKCPLRLVECEHCSNKFKSCELHTHLDVCPKMEVSCELKCGKMVCREDMTQHLKQECGLMVEMCKLGCGVKLTRNELRIHVRDICLQRLIQCEHCKGNFKFCDMQNHFVKCPKMKLSCELCDKILCREDMTQHLEQECVEKEIMCPFVEYNCEVTSIKRKHLSQHLEEKRIEHLELKLNVVETISKDLRRIVEIQSGKIQRQGQEIELLRRSKKKH